MFFTDQLLSRKSSIGVAWLMSTLGQKEHRIQKRDILSASVIEICRTLQDPVTPMALRLTSQLLHGTVLIYNQQTGYLLSDAKGSAQSLVLGNQDTTVSKSTSFQVNDASLPNDPLFTLDFGLVPELPPESDLSLDMSQADGDVEPEEAVGTMADLALEVRYEAQANANANVHGRPSSVSTPGTGRGRLSSLGPGGEELPGDDMDLGLDFEWDRDEPSLLPMDEDRPPLPPSPDQDQGRDMDGDVPMTPGPTPPHRVAKTRARRATVLDAETTLSADEVQEFQDNYELQMQQNKRRKLDTRGRYVSVAPPGTYELLSIIVGRPIHSIGFLDISLGDEDFDMPGLLEDTGGPRSRQSSVEFGRGDTPRLASSRTPSVLDFPRSSQTPVGSDHQQLDNLPERLDDEFQALSPIHDDDLPFSEDVSDTNRLLTQIQQIDKPEISFAADICPPASTSKATAAREFYNILSLATTRCLKISSPQDDFDFFVKLV